MLIVSCDYGEMVTDEKDPQPFVLIDQNADAADTIELRRSTLVKKIAQSIQLDKEYTVCALQFRLSRTGNTCTEDDRVRIALYRESDPVADPDDGSLVALYRCQLSEVPVEGNGDSRLVTFNNYELVLSAGTYWAVIYLYDDEVGGFDEPVLTYYNAGGSSNGSACTYEDDTWDSLPGSGLRMKVFAMESQQ